MRILFHTNKQTYALFTINKTYTLFSHLHTTITPLTREATATDYFVRLRVCVSDTTVSWLTANHSSGHLFTCDRADSWAPLAACLLVWAWMGMRGSYQVVLCVSNWNVMIIPGKIFSASYFGTCLWLKRKRYIWDKSVQYFKTRQYSFLILVYIFVHIAHFGAVNEY